MWKRVENFLWPTREWEPLRDAFYAAMLDINASVYATPKGFRSWCRDLNAEREGALFLWAAIKKELPHE